MHPPYAEHFLLARKEDKCFPFYTLQPEKLSGRKRNERFLSRQAERSPPKPLNFSNSTHKTNRLFHECLKKHHFLPVQLSREFFHFKRYFPGIFSPFRNVENGKKMLGNMQNMFFRPQEPKNRFFPERIKMCDHGIPKAF